MKELLFDKLFSFMLLVIFGPIIAFFSLLIWLQDFCSPLYVAKRIGKGSQEFHILKLRSMTKGADKTGVDSTSANDSRITGLGHFIRRYKLDEISQLINVLQGDMLLVGPRPNVKRETDLYTQEEKKILTIKPGITDFSSIVFSDLGEILKDSLDPDIDYNQLVRPYKSRLCIFYVENRSLILDLQILFLTALNFWNRQTALNKIKDILVAKGVNDPALLTVVERKQPLIPAPPPGSSTIVTCRQTKLADSPR